MTINALNHWIGVVTLLILIFILSTFFLKKSLSLSTYILSLIGMFSYLFYAIYFGENIDVYFEMFNEITSIFAILDYGAYLFIAGFVSSFIFLVGLIYKKEE
ncbi:MAG: hypothetical protein ACLFPL_05845 [Candidatus Nanoarchaeia archaeon]